MTTIVQGVLPYSSQHASAVRALLLDAGWGRDAIPSLTAVRQSRAFVAVANGEVVGFARILTDGESVSYLAELAVAEAYRRQGVARQLLERCQAEAPRARLDVLSTASATGFYAVTGFHVKYGYRRWPQ